jgi:hypothetical protein
LVSLGLICSSVASASLIAALFSNHSAASQAITLTSFHTTVFPNSFNPHLTALVAIALPAVTSSHPPAISNHNIPILKILSSFLAPYGFSSFQEL